MRTLRINTEQWLFREPFVISRGRKDGADVVVVAIADGDHCGRGEGVPYGRFGESMASVRAQLEGARTAIEAGCSRDELLTLLPAGAARNAVDCALWDLHSQQTGEPAYQIAGLKPPQPVVTCYTLSIAEPAVMQAKARDFADWPRLKLKLAGDAHDVARVEAVRAGAPTSELVIDANEAWSANAFERLAGRMAELGVVLIEQPLPAADDSVLSSLPHPVPVCADESLHGDGSLEQLLDRYDAVNIKLDKAGGLSQALRLRDRARELGLGVMVGTMCCTSLSLIPAGLLAQGADIVDLDCGLFLRRDRDDAVTYGCGTMDMRHARWGSGSRPRQKADRTKQPTR